MKKINILAIAVLFAMASCENDAVTDTAGTIDAASDTELVTSQETADLDSEEVDLSIEDFEQIQTEFFNEVNELDLSQVGDLNLEMVDFQNSDLGSGGEEINMGRYHHRPRVTSLCLVKDADRCPFEDRQPKSNMWWPENETDFFNPTTYFSSRRHKRLIFATFSNGTALIRGITSMNDGNCKVYVNVWLRDKQNYDEFSADGGEFKLEPGCASQAADPAELHYYEIDNRYSWLYAWGGDCVGQGCFGLEQRGENLRGQLGPNGAAFDSNIGAHGFSNWGWITDRHTGERLWVMDFDFRLRCCKRKKH